MLAVKAKALYTGHEKPPIKGDVYLVFDEEKGLILQITKEKPSYEILAEGEVITPAFIDAHCHIGMARAGEHPSEEETNEEMDSIVTLADALESVYMDDKSFKESIEYGVLYSCILPGSGNIIGGRAVVIKNYASSIEEAFIRYAGMKVALGFNPRSTTNWKGTRPHTRMGAVALLRKTLIKASNEKKLVEDKKKRIEEVEPEIATLFPILEGKEKLRVHLHKIDDAMILIRLKRAFNLNVVIDHACDIYKEEAFKRIKEEGIPIVYGPIDSFSYKTELKHESWRNIEKLIKIKPYFGLMSDHPVILQRNLFLQLRFFRRYGVSKEEAISIITKRNAEILGIHEFLGTLEPKKWASFIVWNGDPFSLDSYPIYVFAEGKCIFKEK